MRLPKGFDPDRVVTAWAEFASGPGWANTPVWYIWRDTDGTLREGCLQPDEQSDRMLTLFGVAAEAHRAFFRQVVACLRESKLADKEKR